MTAVRGLGGVMLYFCTAWTGLTAVPETWYQRQAPTSNQLNSVAHARQLFVVAGGQGTILTSSNATDWVERFAGTRATLFSAASIHHRYFIGGDGVILSSLDGLDWNYGLFTSRAEEIYGIVDYYYTALGWDRSVGQSYILDSANGGYWGTNSV